MQKKLIVLAVAAALTAPALALADNSNITFYGKAHVSLDSNSGNSGTALTGTKDGLNLTSNSSRFGLKGAEDLGGDLKAVYQYETQVDVQGGASLFTTQRDTYLGVKGGFGTVIAGRLPLANQYANDANFMGDKVGDAGNFTAGGFGGLNLGGAANVLAVPSRVNRAIGYVSPAFGGATVIVGFVPNSAQSVGNTQNVAQKDSSFTVRAAYDQDGIFAAVNYLSLGVAGVNLTPSAAGVVTVGAQGVGIAQSGAKITITSLAGGYDFGVAKLRAQYVSTDANQQAAFSVAAAATGVKQTVFTVGGQFNVDEKNTIKAQFAKAGDVKVSGQTAVGTNATMFAVDYDYSLSKRTTAYVAFAKVSNGSTAQFSATGYAHAGVGAPGATAGIANNPSALSLGLIHDF